MISLIDHTFNVVRKALQILKEDHDKYSICQVTICALAHDLGKIPELRDKNIMRYAQGDHAIASAQIVKSAFSYIIDSMDFIVDAVLSHHRTTKNGQNILLKWLKEADHRARKEELDGLVDKMHRDWDKWFVPGDFLTLIEPHINIIRGNKCNCFNYKSTVYVDPNFLYTKVVEFAIQKDIVDLTLVNPHEKTIAQKRIVGTLRAAGIISSELPDSYYGMQYTVDVGKFAFKIFLTPLKIESFGSLPSFYDQRKTNWLQIIRSVTPYKKPRTK